MPADTAIRITSDCSKALDLSAIFDSPGRPLEIDIGCGKGRFLMARARGNPGTNHLGVDRLIKRLRLLDRKIQEEKLANVRLLHLDASYVVDYMLPPASVSVFYVFFPDPWPKRRHHRHRLFNPTFLNAVHRALRPGGCINAATDHADYFIWITRLLRADSRFVEVPPFLPTEEERTDFELAFMSQNASIGRCAFQKR